MLALDRHSGVSEISRRSGSGIAAERSRSATTERPLSNHHPGCAAPRSSTINNVVSGRPPESADVPPTVRSTSAAGGLSAR